MSYSVKAADLKNISINETDETKSILQNVAIILGTMKGSVPLNREFGISSEILHKPINVVRARLTAEITDAIEMYEPRVSVLKVTFDIDSERPDVIMPTVEVEINE